jgi:hypothetical protein
MAADRQRLAAALAYEQQRRRMMESVPTTDNLPPAQPARRSLRTDLENLSSGIGQGIVNQMEGVKGLITDPVGTVKGAYEGVKGIVRDPSVLADALRYTADKAMSGPLGAGEVVGEMLGPMRGKGPMAEIDVYHGSPHRFEPEETLTVYRGENTANKGGNYWTGDPEFARQFTQSGLENEIKRSTLSTADVYTPPTPVFAGDAKGVDAAIAEAKRLGKSVVRLSEGKSQPDSFYVVEKTALGRTGNPLGAFNASKIGTGEGAQAYGHGIYVAESPDVAKGYAKGVKDMGAIKAMNDEMSQLAKIMGQDEIAGQYRKYKTDAGRNAAKRYDELMAQRQGVVDSPGNLYTADLPDEMVDRMLDWDKPLSEQSDFVKKTLGVTEGYFAVPLSSGEKMYAHGKSMAGVDLINELTSLMGEGNKAAASEYLKSKGIPGIRYLDAGSRGQGGSGTRNFVVFPGEEKKVKILKRE